jgi:Sporulation inhibitor A
MKILDDKTLIEIYKKAIELNINKDFLYIIASELTRRGLSLDIEIDS